MNKLFWQNNFTVFIKIGLKEPQITMMNDDDDDVWDGETNEYDD